MPTTYTLKTRDAEAGNGLKGSCKSTRPEPKSLNSGKAEPIPRIEILLPASDLAGIADITTVPITLVPPQFSSERPDILVLQSSML